MYIPYEELEQIQVMRLFGSTLKKRVNIPNGDVHMMEAIERQYKTRFMSMLNAFYSLSNSKGKKIEYSLKVHGCGEVKDKVTVTSCDFFIYEAFFCTGLGPTGLAKLIRIFCHYWNQYNDDQRNEIFEHLKQRYFIDDIRLQEDLDAK